MSRLSQATQLPFGRSEFGVVTIPRLSCQPEDSPLFQLYWRPLGSIVILKWAPGRPTLRPVLRSEGKLDLWHSKAHHPGRGRLASCVEEIMSGCCMFVSGLPTFPADGPFAGHMLAWLRVTFGQYIVNQVRYIGPGIRPS